MLRQVKTWKPLLYSPLRNWTINIAQIELPETTSKSLKVWLCLWSSSAGCVTWSRCSWDARVCPAGKYLHSWDLGSGISFARVCYTTWSFWLTSSPCLTSGWEKRELCFQKHLLFYFFWSTKYPSATQMKCFISGETQTLCSTWNNFFPIQKNQWTKRLVIPSPLCVPHLLNQMVL